MVQALHDGGTTVEDRNRGDYEGRASSDHDAGTANVDTGTTRARDVPGGFGVGGSGVGLSDIADPEVTGSGAGDAAATGAGDASDSADR